MKDGKIEKVQEVTSATYGIFQGRFSEGNEAPCPSVVMGSIVPGKDILNAWVSDELASYAD